jgi:hypothetical protein
MSQSSHLGYDMSSRKLSEEPHHGPHALPSTFPFLYLPKAWQANDLSMRRCVFLMDMKVWGEVLAGYEEGERL